MMANRRLVPAAGAGPSALRLRRRSAGGATHRRIAGRQVGGCSRTGGSRHSRRLVDELTGLGPGLGPAVARGGGAGLIPRLILHCGPPQAGLCIPPRPATRFARIRAYAMIECATFPRAEHLALVTRGARSMPTVRSPNWPLPANAVAASATASGRRAGAVRLMVAARRPVTIWSTVLGIWSRRAGA